MIRPKLRDKIALTDLKKCRMTPIFFDTFFNLEKYLDHEQRDPFASQRDVDEDGNEVGYVYAANCKTVLPHNSKLVLQSLKGSLQDFKRFSSFQMSDWDRFAAEEYELLVAEEGNAEGLDEL